MKSYDLDLNKRLIFSPIYMGIIISFTFPVRSGRKITKNF